MILLHNNQNKKFGICLIPEDIDTESKKIFKNNCDTTIYYKQPKKKPIGYIYLANNTLNKKVYVGKVELSKTIRERWEEHLRKGRKLRELRKKFPNKKIYARHIYNAIAKYDSEVWAVRQIDIAYNKEELNEKERYWIKKYDSMDPRKGYNMTEGGESGKKRPEVKKRISKSVEELWQDPDYQEKQSSARKEMWERPDYREKVTKSRKKLWQNPEFKKEVSGKISKSIEELWQDSEYQEKQSSAKKEVWERPEYREQRSEFMKELWQDNEFKEKQKEKISKAMKELWEDSEYQKREGERISNLNKKRWQNPQYKQKVKKKMSESAKERWKDPEYRTKQTEALRKKLRKEIHDKDEFLNDIKNAETLQDLIIKYNICGKTINARIKEILRSYGKKTFTEAKEFLRDKNVKDILNGLDDND